MTATVNINASIALSSDAQNKLSALSEDISKDVAAMTISNRLGVNAMAPQVRDIINNNTSKSSTTAASSITNISQNTNATADGTGNVTITAPGTINIKNTTIDANVCATLIVKQIMTQAVTNGLDLAVKTLSDNKSVQGILNEVKGLDDFQKALNEAIKAGTDNTLPPGGSSSMMKYALIGGLILVALVVLPNLIPKGGSQQPIVLSRFKSSNSHKFGYRMITDYNGYKIILGFIIALVLLYIGLYLLIKKIKNG